MTDDGTCERYLDDVQDGDVLTVPMRIRDVPDLLVMVWRNSEGGMAVAFRPDSYDLHELALSYGACVPTADAAHRLADDVRRVLHVGHDSTPVQ